MIVAARSTFGVDAFSHTCTAPAPITVVFAARGLVVKLTALPSGGAAQW